MPAACIGSTRRPPRGEPQVWDSDVDIRELESTPAGRKRHPGRHYDNEQPEIASIMDEVLHLQPNER